MRVCRKYMLLIAVLIIGITWIFRDSAQPTIVTKVVYGDIHVSPSENTNYRASEEELNSNTNSSVQREDEEHFMQEESESQAVDAGSEFVPNPVLDVGSGEFSSMQASQLNSEPGSGREDAVAENPDGAWQGSTHDPLFQAFSAIYDTRRLWDPAGDVVIVLALKQTRFSGDELAWTLSYTDGTVREFVAGSVTCHVTGTQYTTLCIIPVLHNQSDGSASVFPATVTADLVGPPSRRLLHLPVHLPATPQSKEELVLCSKAIYTLPEATPLSVSYLVTWLELQRAVGISQVALYNISMPAAWASALRHYMNDGFLTLRPSSPTATGKPYTDQQSTVIMDCVFRHMHSHRWVLVIDMDEVVVPNMDRTIPQMISRIQTLHNLSRDAILDLKFQNVYFYTDHPAPDPQRNESLAFFKYQYRKPYAAERLPTLPKSASNPAWCAQRMPHFCNKLKRQVPDSVTRQKVGLVVSKEIGAVRQFKRCKKGGLRHSPQACLAYMEAAAVHDTRMLEYEAEVTERAGHVIGLLAGPEGR